jgi:PKD repeat protein
LGIVALIASSSCGESLGPLASVASPDALTVEAVSINAVRLSWQAVDDDDVSGYRIERRKALQGSFEPLPDHVVHSGSGLVVFFDTDVEPETYYGYRIVAVSRFGDRSIPSVIGGTRTPPLPGIQVTTVTTAPNPGSFDPDGYRVTIAGPDSVSAAIGLSASRRFSALRAGTYAVTLDGVHPQCAIAGSPSRTVVVVDTGVQTLQAAAFAVTCRDPSRGEVVAVVSVRGDSLPNRYDLTFVGLVSDATLPDEDRIVSLRQSIPSSFGGATTFANLRSGSYEVALDSLAGQCDVDGTTTRAVTVTAGSIDTVFFPVSCEGAGSTVQGPYEWVNAWQVATASNGQRVKLRVNLDFSASPAIRIATTQGEIRYDPAVLRFESFQAVPGGFDGPLWNNVQSGVLAGLSLDNSGLGKTGVIPVVELEFTVVGASGTRAITRTTVTEVVSASFEEYRDSTRVIEDTLQIGAGGGGGTNQAPVAAANGPYSGTVGAAITFSSTGSSDPDGSIANFGWSFGDGSSGTGATVTHAYAAAGTYAVTLTVTDDRGATDSDQATVTVVGNSGGANQPPVAEAGGPYSGTVGSAITFLSAGSTDPDGSITSHQWSFGDGGSASGVSATHTYQTAGSYTATLTVTDDQGATASDQAAVTVSPPSAQQPFVWAYSVAAPDQNGVVAVTITYDLRANISETPGPEALQNWTVSSLEWDPAVMEYFAFNFGPNGGGTVNPTNAPQGRLSFSGTQPTTHNSGVMTLATIRFRLIGPTGSSTTTRTTLGTLVSTPQNGSYNYTSRTRVVEATIRR